MNELLPYDVFYRRPYATADELQAKVSWDVFISAFNSSERVRETFTKMRAPDKRWLVHREYEFLKDDLPKGALVYVHETGDESDCIENLFEGASPIDLTAKLCVDITGFMRPHLMYLVRYLAFHGVKTFDVLYTEPSQYRAMHKTMFAGGSVPNVRQVAGFQGIHTTSPGGRDLLVIGVGYEHELIKLVSEEKTSASKIPLYSFPALQADFYQEGILQVERAAEALSAMESSPNLFAPAYDPFETAAVLHRLVERERIKRNMANIYLCPIATKVQALGFALYYIYECIDKEFSIVYPFATAYSKDTAVGLARVWHYTIELPRAV